MIGRYKTTRRRETEREEVRGIADKRKWQDRLVERSKSAAPGSGSIKINLVGGAEFEVRTRTRTSPMHVMSAGVVERSLMRGIVGTMWGDSEQSNDTFY